MENKIRQDLFEIQDLKYKEFHGSLCPDMDNIIGVRIPKLREYAKELYKSNKLEDIKIGDKYYVQMANAWAISICLIRYYNKTLEFLKTTKIDDFTYNKGIQKAIESYRITKEQKDYLKTLKRGK